MRKGLIFYFMISAVGHLSILGVFIFTPWFSQNEQEFSPITVLIKPDSVTVDFEPERIQPSELFSSEPLQMERAPEITVLPGDEITKEDSNQSSDNPSSVDYSTEARPILDGYNKLPPYPRLARQLEQEGQVILSVEINEKGLASNIAVVKSSGYKLLDDAAVKTVRGWIFIPATKNGKPVKSRLEIPIRFKLT